MMRNKRNKKNLFKIFAFFDEQSLFNRNFNQNRKRTIENHHFDTGGMQIKVFNKEVLSFFEKL